MSLAMPTTHRTFDAQPITPGGATSDLPQDDEQSLFSREELREFEADDIQIMSRIGMILSALFDYTVVVMAVAIWWTFRTVGH